MKIIDCVQGSPEWLAARCGKVTASRICDVLAKLKKGGEPSCRRDYRIQLVAEILTGQTEDQYVSKEMEWGTANEPFARASYEIAKNVMVEQVGFVLHPRIDRAGGSPDGLVGDDGGLEIKCPKTTTHIEWLLADVVPEEHQGQLLFNMACADRSWWDFCSYDPRLPEQYRLFVKRMHRDDTRIAEIEKEVEQFLLEVDSLILSLPCGDGRSAVERQMEATLAMVNR